MAGNALTEIIVFGCRAGKYAAEYAGRADWIAPEADDIKKEHERVSGFFKPKGLPPKDLRRRIGAMMSESMGVTRNEMDLKKALTEIRFLRTDHMPNIRVPGFRQFNVVWMEAIEVPYMLDVAKMMIKSALFRAESRGGHFREDYPDTEPGWLKHTLVKKKDHNVVIDSAPVVITKLMPSGD